MRLLLLLSFLAGSWPIISSNTDQAPSNTPESSTKQPLQDQSSVPGAGTTTVNATVDGKEKSTMENNTSPTTSSEATTSSSPNAAPTGTMKGPPTTALEQNTSKPDSTVLTSHVSITSQNDGSSTTEEPTTSSTTASPESNNISVNPTSLSSSQDMSTFSSKPTSAPKSNTPTEIQSTSNERISPSITTEPTERKNDSAVTGAAGNVQMTTVNETGVKNQTDRMEENKVSGTFMDSTGSTEKSTPSGTQGTTTDVTHTTETMKTTTEAVLKKKTQEPKETIIPEAYCVAEPSKPHHHLKIKKVTDCETFVKKKGKVLAGQICSHLAEKGALKMFDKCEVHFSPEKEDQSNLIIDVFFKVNDDQMNGVHKTLEEFEMNQEHEGSKEQQRATELKKLIAMVVTGSLLLLVFLSAIVYRCSQRKSKHKDPYLTEELRTVDNGCHDNPAMDITERDSEMEEKNNSKGTFLENTDGWIVPMDTHIKDELEEEDTHL